MLHLIALLFDINMRDWIHVQTQNQVGDFNFERRKNVLDVPEDLGNVRYVRKIP
jgi:hypothetical protein